MKKTCIATFCVLLAYSASAEVITRSLNRALANSLYCQLAGCTMTGIEFLPNGSGAAPSQSFTNFPTFGLYAETGFFEATMGESAFRVMGQTTAPTALTTALVVIAGNIDTGSHSYKVTFVTASGETEGGTVSNAVVNDGTHAQNTLTAVPVSAFPGVTSRKIYRNKVADQTHWFLQQTIANNTATTGVQDNTADSGLTTAMPTTNTALDARVTFANSGAATMSAIAVTGTISASGSGMLASAFPVGVGSGTATANVSGTYAKFVSGTGVGNGADTTFDALWTLTAIPVNTFTANGDALVLTLGGQMGATANNKAFGVSVGGTAVNTGNNGGNNVGWWGTATITRVDTTHVNVILAVLSFQGSIVSANSLNLVVADLTTNTLAVVVTGASPTTGAANDVKLYSGLAEFKK